MIPIAYFYLPTETTNVSTYPCPTSSNRLTSVTPAGQSPHSFACAASGGIVTDTRAGGCGMSFDDDVEALASPLPI